MLQASVAAPTASFRSCLRDAAVKATSEKVSADAIEDYLRGACTVQMGTLKNALIAFRLKNGMAKKSASADADMTVEDYVATPADNYRFIVERDAKLTAAAAKPAAAAAPAASVQPAASPQPPKP